MHQGLKVDIVYYKMKSDFEMEFNLRDCCRMRLFTDKAGEKKEYLNMFADAVRRSKIIISCGLLSSYDGLIYITALSIGGCLETVNNIEYGIKSGDEIQIIKGSTPLVTPEGIFGGCMLTSGSQTIILLSESRLIRKAIMRELIHPYLKNAGCLNTEQTEVEEDEKVKKEIAEEKNDEVSVQVDDEEITKIITEETYEKNVVNVDVTEEKTMRVTSQKGDFVSSKQSPTPFVLLSGEKQDTKPFFASEIESTLVIEPNKAKYSKKNNDDLMYDYSLANTDVCYNDKGEVPFKKSKKRLIIITIFILLVLLLGSCFFFNYMNILKYIKTALLTVINALKSF